MGGSGSAMDIGGTTGTTSNPAASGIAADRPSSPAARASRPRPRTTDER
jgi:hypothetical protein